MKKSASFKLFSSFTLLLLLTGCSAKHPVMTNLQLQLQSQNSGIYVADVSATLRGHDARQASEVVIYQLKDKPDMRLPNRKDPHILITEHLATGLLEQGMVFEAAAPVHIQLDLNELAAVVTHPKLLYSAKARSHLTLTIKNKKFSLKKSYDREANRDSIKRPPVPELEKMLNGQLTEIIQQILQDAEVQAAINQQ